MAAQTRDNGTRAKSQRNDEQSPQDRRRFLAEAAALTLFGAVGLEAVIDAVLKRLQDLQATRELATAIGEQVKRAGLRSEAAAEVVYCPA